MAQTFADQQLPLVAPLLQDGRLREGLQILTAVSENMMTWEITQTLRDIDRGYALMLEFLAHGGDDPHREQVYSSLMTKAWRALDRLTRHNAERTRATLYYDALRMRRSRRGMGDPSLRQLLEALRRANAEGSDPFGLTGEANTETDAEETLDKAFDYIWTVYPLDGDDFTALTGAVSDPALTLRQRQQLVAALGLGLMEFYDPERLSLLASLSGRPEDEDDDPVSVRAMTGLALGLYKYRQRPLEPAVRERIDALVQDTRDWPQELRALQLELIRTRDTDRVSRRIRDRLIPDIMKMSPEMMSKLQQEKPLNDDPEDQGLNPEWAKLLEDSKLGKSIREISEMQMEGADVMMASFSHLKSFPFFHRVAHWTMPFDPDHPEVVKALDQVGDLSGMFGQVIRRLPQMCDNDRYSMIMVLSRLPEEQRQGAMDTFQAAMDQGGEQYEAHMANQTRLDRRRAMMSGYLRDLYRFYRLYRRKGEFQDPFAAPIELYNVGALSAAFDNDPDWMKVVAEVHFRNKSWDEAIGAYTRLLDMGARPDAVIFQKVGHAHRRAGRLKEALEALRQAELFDGMDTWTLRNLAGVTMQMKAYGDAIGYLRRLIENAPDDVGAMGTLGYALMKDRRWEEAIEQYYKYLFHKPEDTSMRRALSWSLLVTGQLEKARGQMEKLLEEDPCSEDYINLGHVAVAQGNMPEAINYYRLAMANNAPDDHRTLVERLQADAPMLTRAGIDPAKLILLADAAAIE